MFFKDFVFIVTIVIALSCIPDENSIESELAESTLIHQKRFKNTVKSVDSYIDKCKKLEDSIITEFHSEYVDNNVRTYNRRNKK